MHFDLIFLIKTFGYLGVFAIVFLESGLLIGFFFPGDSLLFTAGFLASQGYLDIGILITGCFVFRNSTKVLRQTWRENHNFSSLYACC